MKIINKLIFTTCFAAAISMSSFASEVGVKGERIWINQADGIARCNNIEGFIDIAGFGEVKKADVKKIIITDFAMDYLYKINLFLDTNNRAIYESGTFADAVKEYTNLSEIVIENLIDTYENDNRKTEGVTTKEPYEGNFYALFLRAPRDLNVTIENINLLKTKLKNARVTALNTVGSTIRIMIGGLKTVNIATSWTENGVPGLLNFSGSSQTLTNFFVNRFDILNTSSFLTFKNFTNLKNITINNLNIPNATSFTGMFNGCTSLKTCLIRNSNTGTLTDVSCMFNNCPALDTIDLGTLSFDSATNTSSMFSGCSAIKALDLSSRHFKSVNNASYMFKNCSSLESLKVGTLNLSGIADSENAAQMFAGCGLPGNIKISFGSFTTPSFPVTFSSFNGSFAGFMGIQNINPQPEENRFR